jgi:hypothetical protein
MVRGSRSEKLLVLVVIAPILAGPAQDRYLLPIQPLLFFYGWLLYRDFAARLRSLLAARKALGSAPPPPPT